MRGDAHIAVVIPAFREASRIGAVVGTVPDWVDVVVVVDDASADETSSEAVHAGAAWTGASARRFELVRHSHNRGVGAAIVSGYRRAIAAGADVLAVMAGDGQMDPGDLARVVAPIVAGRADYVKGNRFQHGERRHMPLARRVAGKGLALATRIATGLAVDDSQCGFTAIAASTARTLPLDDLWPRYGYPNDLLGLLAAARCRVEEVPVRPIYAGEPSGIRFWHAGVILALIARRWLRTKLA